MSLIYDSIIIGAGPAGLSAGLYAARARLKVKIFEAHFPGGQVLLTQRIDNYPGFPQGLSSHDLISRMSKQVAGLGLNIDTAKIEALEIPEDQPGERIFKVHSDVGEFQARTLIIATGAIPRRLGISGEKELTAKGVSYCATCDAPMFKDKTVVVIGGGNAAVEEAIFLSRFVKKLFLIHRRSKLRAVSVLAEQLREIETCEIIFNTVAVSVEGRQRVRGLKIKNVVDGKIKDIDCEGVFIFVGFDPSTDLAKDFLKRDDKGFIIVDKRMQTSEKGIFACGDCVAKDLRQVVTACSDGAQAAYSATNYLIEY